MTVAEVSKIPYGFQRFHMLDMLILSLKMMVGASFRIEGEKLGILSVCPQVVHAKRMI